MITPMWVEFPSYLSTIHTQYFMGMWEWKMLPVPAWPSAWRGQKTAGWGHKQMLQI